MLPHDWCDSPLSTELAGAHAFASLLWPRFCAFSLHRIWRFYLRLGADENTITLCHWAEYLADIPNKRRVRRRYVREDIGEQWIESLDDCEGIAYYSGDDYFTQLWLDYKPLAVSVSAR